MGALGIANQLLGLRGTNTGFLIAQKIKGIKGVGEKKWGFHPSFIGECYLSYGFLGVVLLGGVFGALLRSIYYVEIRMLGSPIGMTFCAIAMVYSFRIFFESINKTMEGQVALLFLVSGPLVARLFRPSAGDT